MVTAAPIIVREMDEWEALGGGNSGIVGDANHTYGFHCAADEISADDYSRWRDPNGSDGPYVNWDYACAGDFDHKNNSSLRAKHADLLNRLMAGQHPMICEFIGKPWADKPVYYWARWNGIGTLEKYTGEGHDHWSHVSWYRSRVDEYAGLWKPSSGPYLRRHWPSDIPTNEYFGLITGPNASHGGYYANERDDVKAIQQRMIKLGFAKENGKPITDVNAPWADGKFEQPTKDAVSAWQKKHYAAQTTRYGEVWTDDWQRLFTY